MRIPGRPLPAAGSPTRRGLLVVIGSGLALALSSHLDSDGSPAATDSATSPGFETPRRYAGTARTTIDYVDPVFDEGDRATVENDVTVTVGPPVGAETSDPEANPFGLAVDRTAEAEAEEPASQGLALLRSARLDPGGTDGQDDVRRFWDIAPAGNDAYTGVLRAPPQPGDRPSNVLRSHRELVPGRPGTTVPSAEAIDAGAELRAEVSADEVAIDVAGNTRNSFADDLLDGTRPFETEIRAERVE